MPQPFSAPPYKSADTLVTATVCAVQRTSPETGPVVRLPWRRLRLSTAKRRSVVSGSPGTKDPVTLTVGGVSKPKVFSHSGATSERAQDGSRLQCAHDVAEGDFFGREIRLHQRRRQPPAVLENLTVREPRQQVGVIHRGGQRVYLFAEGCEVQSP